MHGSERLNGVIARSLLVATLASMAVASSLATGVAAAADPAHPTSNRDPGGGGGGGGGVPDRRIALGLASPQGRDLGLLDALTLLSGGNRPAMWVIWSQWGNPGASEFPTDTAVALRDRGIMPTIWWEPVRSSDLSDPTYARHRNITSGMHDAYIRQFARDARDFGGTVILRFAQEANANHFPWGIGRFDNTAQTFIAAWRHVHDLFASVGADNVRFLWSVSRQHCAGGCNPYMSMYPGHAYVDIMGFSGYNWGTTDGGTWTSMYDLYRRSVEHMRELSGTKPIMVAETGSASAGGDKAAWVRDGYRRVYDELPDIGAVVYLHANLLPQGHRDWRLTNPPEAMAAYAEIAGLERFSARSPFAAQRTLARIAADERAERHERRMERRLERQRKEAREEAAAQQDRRERIPLVHRGSASADKPGDGGGQSSASATNRQSKSKRRNADDQPPAVVDTFNR